MRIIAGEARGRKLFPPKNLSVRPPLDRIRGAIFSLIRGTFEGGRVLDLFAGVGSLGLEAVSRGAREALFVESEPSTLAILEKNIQSLGFSSRCKVLRGDALRVPDLRRMEPSSYALVFLDPPFIMFESERTAGQVFARVKEILTSVFFVQGGAVLLRHPSRYRQDCPIPAIQKKTYGESTILRFGR